MKKCNRNNKVILVLLLILLICFGIIGFAFYKFFYAGVSTSKYGDRLDGIDKYVLPDSLSNDINDLYSDNSNVDGVSVDVEGKIIYLVYTFSESLHTSDAKTLATKALDVIGEDNLSFYDVQFILTIKDNDSNDEDENTNYPIFGAKSVNSNKIVW